MYASSHCISNGSKNSSMVIFSWTASCNVSYVSIQYTRPLVRTGVYLEATTDSGVEVRDLAEDSLVHFPLAISTDDCEVREFSRL